jgi:type IV pilus assembly protein PilW
MHAMTLRTQLSRPARARGFSLVEILVGVAIGMVGMLVIFRTVATWDTHSRSTTSGSDAQTAGSLAMFNFERDVKQAGLGFMGIGAIVAPGPGQPPPNTPTSLGCSVTFNDTATGRVLPFNMVPVQITVGALGAPDTVNVLYGNSAFFVTRETFDLSTVSTKTLARNNNGFKTGDLAIAAKGLVCQLIQVTSYPDGKTVAHAPGNYVSFYYGPAASTVARYNAAVGPAFTDGDIYNLGPRPRRNTWQVNPQRAVLTSAEFFQGDPAVEVAEGVVNLKAQYGMDTNGDRVVNAWTNTLPIPTTPAVWAQVIAVRVAMLVRSRQFEKTADQSADGVPQGVTTLNPTWAGSTDPSGNGGFLMTNVDGTPDTFGPNDADPNNWRFYRYRVYEKEILLRNVHWGTSPGSLNVLAP